MDTDPLLSYLLEVSKYGKSPDFEYDDPMDIIMLCIPDITVYIAAACVDGSHTSGYEITSNTELSAYSY